MQEKLWEWILKRSNKASVLFWRVQGEDPNREGLLKTPARVARMYEECFAGLYEDPAQHFETTFDEHHEEMVLVRDIPFYSMCEHHLAPFFGVAHVAYIPAKDGHVCGLSKLARLVDVYARRPQVQERLTTQVANTLMEQLNLKVSLWLWKLSIYA